MSSLEITRNKIDQLIAFITADSKNIGNIQDDPYQMLKEFDVFESERNIPLYAWSPVPSSITACPSCLFKPTIANPRTSADCPPRPAPGPSPSPSPSPSPKH